MTTDYKTVTHSTEISSEVTTNNHKAYRKVPQNTILVH